MRDSAFAGVACVAILGLFAAAMCAGRNKSATPAQNLKSRLLCMSPRERKELFTLLLIGSKGWKGSRTLSDWLKDGELVPTIDKAWVAIVGKYWDEGTIMSLSDAIDWASATARQAPVPPPAAP